MDESAELLCDELDGAITELLREAIDEDLTDNEKLAEPIFRGRGEETMALAADMGGDLDPALVLGTPVFRRTRSTS